MPGRLDATYKSELPISILTRGFSSLPSGSWKRPDDEFFAREVFRWSAPAEARHTCPDIPPTFKTLLWQSLGQHLRLPYIQQSSRFNYRQSLQVLFVARMVLQNQFQQFQRSWKWGSRNRVLTWVGHWYWRSRFISEAISDRRKSDKGNWPHATNDERVEYCRLLVGDPT